MKSAELFAKSADLAKQARNAYEASKAKATAEKRDLTDDEVKVYRALLAESDKYKAEAEDVARMEGNESRADESRGRRSDPDPTDRNSRPGREPEISEETRCLALSAWFKRNKRDKSEISDRERDACKRTRIDPEASSFTLDLMPAHHQRRMRDSGWGAGYSRSFDGAELRAMSALVGSSGGFFIGDTLLTQLEVNMLAYGGVLQAAETIRTATGENMPWPTIDYTTIIGSQLGEGVAAGTSVAPSAGRVTWGAYEFTSNACLVPTALIEDSIFDLPGIVGQMLGEALGRILNTKFTTGTGAATPKGIVTAATAATMPETSAATTASATAIAWDEVTNLIHSIDPALRPGSAFMFSDGIYQHLRKLKDGMGRPLWADGPNSTPPADLQGYRYFINQDMASAPIASAETMLFGRLEKYKVRMVNQVRFYRLVEAYRLQDQDAFVAFVRADGNLLTAGTAPVKKLVQHA